jgi:hypothetical protein
MSETSRRRFLAVSGASAVAFGVAAAVPASLASASMTSNAAEPSYAEGLLGAEPMIVSVDDLSTGQISVMHGDREFVTSDPELARRIAQLAGLGA